MRINFIFIFFFLVLALRVGFFFFFSFFFFFFFFGGFWVPVLTDGDGRCAHLNLLVLRCRNLWRSRFWERQFLPAGGVTIEFNLRALRVDGAGDRSARIEGRTEDERLVEV